MNRKTVGVRSGEKLLVESRVSVWTRSWELHMRSMSTYCIVLTVRSREAAVGFSWHMFGSV